MGSFAKQIRNNGLRHVCALHSKKKTNRILVNSLVTQIQKKLPRVEPKLSWKIFIHFPTVLSLQCSTIIHCHPERLHRAAHLVESSTTTKTSQLPHVPILLCAKFAHHRELLACVYLHLFWEVMATEVWSEECLQFLGLRNGQMKAVKQ